MSGTSKSRREPRSPAHQRLGAALYQLRNNRGLTQRQLGGDDYSDSHLSNVENGHALPSTELLEHYVRKCGGNFAELSLLRNQALASNEERRRERRAAERGQALDTASGRDLYNPPEPHRLYSLASIETRTTYDGHGIPVELRATISMRAKVTGLNRYYFGIGCHTDYRPGVISLEAGYGCSLGHFTESKQGVWNGYFQLDQELSPDDLEPHEFSFRVVYHTHVRAEQPIISQPKTETARYVMHVQFVPPSLPTKVWWFDVPTAVEVEDDQPDANTFTPDASGYYRKEFTNLTIGRVYGINWWWE